MFDAKIALNGGYVGVDIFFVIRPYLITALIVKDLQKGTERRSPLFGEPSDSGG